MKYSGGARRSHPDKLARAKPASLHPVLAAILATTLVASASLATHEPSRLDQGQTGSCTAHSLCGAVYTAMAGALPFVPSPDLDYKGSRSLERAAAAPVDGTLPELQDVGAELADAIQSMAVDGIAPMAGPAADGRNSDCDPATVNDELDVARLEAAATTVITGEYRITVGGAPGASLSDQVAAAIAAGFPVYVGFFVDSLFEDLQPGQVAQAPNEADPNGGGHAVYLSAFTTNADGSRTFTLTNSWGTGWCDQGRCLVSEAWLAAAWELWVVDVKVQKGAVS